MSDIPSSLLDSPLPLRTSPATSDHGMNSVRAISPAGPGVATFVSRLKQTFEQGKDSDLTIICNGRQWKVHKLILCLHSNVSEKMLRGNFKESSQREIALANDSPDALDALFHWMYTFEHKLHMSTDRDLSTLVLDMHIAKTADFYGIRELHDIAVKSFKSTGDASSINEQFVDAISEAYFEDGFEQFRSILVGHAAAQLEKLRAEPHKYASFWNLVDACGQFASALLRAPVPQARALPHVGLANHAGTGYRLPTQARVSNRFDLLAESFKRTPPRRLATSGFQWGVPQPQESDRKRQRRHECI